MKRRLGRIEHAQAQRCRDLAERVRHCLRVTPPDDPNHVRVIELLATAKARMEASAL